MTLEHVFPGSRPSVALPLVIPVKHIPIKRLFDCFFSVAILALALPLLILIAAGIRLSSRGSILFWQKRVGRGGKPFRCYKFRTMHPNAEERLAKLLASDPAIRREWESSRKLINDPRVTRFGRFLRKTSLDEFPQFWNVLMGDLSVVGPRPVLEEELAEFYGAKAKKVLSIRPGITGLWQVSGRNDLSYEERVILDEAYVDSHSTLMDIRLILKTIPCVLFSKGAY